MDINWLDVSKIYVTWEILNNDILVASKSKNFSEIISMMNQNLSK